MLEPSEEASEDEIQNATPNPQKRAPHILFAEDDPDMRRLVATALRKFGYQVSSFSDGKQFLDQLDKSAALQVPVALPDIIVSDLRMPNASGFDILQKLKQRAASVPVVIVTAFGDPETHYEVRRLGADYVMNKPFDIDDLLTVIINLTAKRRVQGGIDPTEDS